MAEHEPSMHKVLHLISSNDRKNGYISSCTYYLDIGRSDKLFLIIYFRLLFVLRQSHYVALTGACNYRLGWP